MKEPVCSKDDHSDRITNLKRASLNTYTQEQYKLNVVKFNICVYVCLHVCIYMHIYVYTERDSNSRRAHELERKWKET